MNARVLVAGVGNIFFGDDGFGVAVARRMAADADALPAGVRVRDFGISGLHLAYELLEPFDLLVVVDAVHRDGAPGTLYAVEPELDPAGEGAGDAHGMDLPGALAAASALGATRPPIVLVGCEPADMGEGIRLSPAVERAIDPAIALVGEIIARRLGSGMEPAQKAVAATEAREEVER